MKRYFRIATLLSLICFIASAHANVQEGDLIFQTSNSSQSVAIQQATNSPYSHMGVILLKKSEPYVFEAAATVRYTPLKTWLANGNQGHYVVKRLKNASSLLTSSALVKLHNEAKYFMGRRYDLTFEWSDKRIYCSELVWKLYNKALNIQLGALQKLKEFNLSTPAVKAKLKERYGEHIPTEELVISPANIFKSDLLITVEDKYYQSAVH